MGIAALLPSALPSLAALHTRVQTPPLSCPLPTAHRGLSGWAPLLSLEGQSLCGSHR